MSDTVKFTEEDVTKYLDDCIRYWRKVRASAVNQEADLMASCYVDAFQTVRVSLFGKLLDP